jgi:nitroreductase
MEFSELVKYRQSDRKYSDKPVEREKLLQCIEAARLAPSANNSQPWKFIIVDQPELKEQIAALTVGLGMNKFTNEAPVMVAVVLEKMDVPTSMASVLKNKEFSLMDVGMAVMQFCLQAADIGLGTCIIGWFDEKKVKKLLSIPDKKRVPLLITVGYSEARTRNKIRKSPEEMSSWNRY